MGIGEEQILEYFRFTKVTSEAPLGLQEAKGWTQPVSSPAGNLSLDRAVQARYRIYSRCRTS